MNEKKIIKDLKERNEKLLNQYRLCDIRKLYLEQENKQLKEINEKHKKLNGELRKENKKYKEVIDKLKEWIYIVQQNKDTKHLDPFISTDELDELLDILKEGD